MLTMMGASHSQSSNNLSSHVKITTSGRKCKTGTPSECPSMTDCPLTTSSHSVSALPKKYAYSEESKASREIYHLVMTIPTMPASEPLTLSTILTSSQTISENSIETPTNTHLREKSFLSLEGSILTVTARSVSTNSVNSWDALVHWTDQWQISNQEETTLLQSWANQLITREPHH